MKKWHVIVLLLAVAVLAGGLGAYAAGTAGTQGDPLISMSYLDDVLAPSIRSAYTSRIESEARELEESVQNSLADAAGAFEAVSLAEGEGTPCPAGTQLLFRSGSAICSASTSAALEAGPHGFPGSAAEMSSTDSWRTRRSMSATTSSQTSST